MIGNKIRGIDINSGQKIEGKVLDKVRSISMMEMKAPGQVGPGNRMPIAIDVYLVHNEDTGIHLVAPQTISAIGFPLEQDIVVPAGQA